MPTIEEINLEIGTAIQREKEQEIDDVTLGLMLNKNKVTLESIIACFKSLEGVLNTEELKNACRIINNREEKSYLKLYNFLKQQYELRGK